MILKRNIYLDAPLISGCVYIAPGKRRYSQNIFHSSPQKCVCQAISNEYPQHVFVKK